MSTNGPTAPIEMFDRLICSITITHVICLVGVLLFAYWLLHTSLGAKSLAHSLPRRHRMPLFLPFAVLFLWFASASAVKTAAVWILGEQTGRPGDLLDNAVHAVSCILTIAVTVVVARVMFVRGLKGFGLRLRTIPKDFAAALANLLAVWPLVLAAIIATALVGKTLWGQDYEVPQHQELQVITETPQLLLVILVFVLAAVVVPVVEELVFRGLFQSVIRSLVIRPWLAVVVSSVLFISVHQDMAHWPGLFVLSLAIGYSYEKSGSLLRPIFIHALFNGITILLALAE